ncbi:phage terminase small subunit P27 family [Roseicella sp. DB1501]|uniref:phage terminase small subunit P27 family n=1 Tax=Roseicella sp. DB1501 TaxID=2730925 RepID=UPI001491ADAE|nr:phage terminase small subunit P27 family [Roseicella sp. DB1501]NOG69800.1 phage terminase small subunit P27 family [Roseicella sp. DB1501]
MPYPRKPTALKKLEGTARKDRVLPNEPMPDRLVADAPRHLSKRAKRVWPDFVTLLNGMGVLTVADAYALEAVVECYAELADARAALRKRGSTTYEANGLWKSYPEVQIVADADRRLKAWLTEFGCTPAARTKVSASTEKDDKNPFEEL